MSQRGIEALNRLTHYIEQLESERDKIKAELESAKEISRAALRADRDHWRTLALAAKEALEILQPWIEHSEDKHFKGIHLENLLSRFPPEEKKP